MTAARLLARGQHHQAAGVLVVPGPHDPAAGQPGRHAGHDLQPVRVGVRQQHAGLAGARIQGQQPHRPLVPALHHDQRLGLLGPAHGDQVRELRAVGLDRAVAAVEPGQQQGHLGVRGAGRGVGDLGGRPFRVGGVGDVPPGDRGLVGPGHEQGRAVRGPPVAALAVHLLGRDELGQPERHTCRAPRIRDRHVAADPSAVHVSQAGDPQRAGADIGQPPPGGVGPRVKRRGLRGHGPRCPPVAGQRHRVHLPGQREGGQGHGPVGGVGHDPARRLPDPLPPGPFGRGQVLLVGAFPVRAERPRIGHQVLLAADDVQDPQARHRVGAAVGAQEGDPAAVRGDAERTRYAQGEPPGPRLLARETVGHVMNVASPGQARARG